jgi:hypothetical protein
MPYGRPGTLGFFPLLLLSAVATELAAQTIQSPYRHVETSHSVSVFGGFLTTDAGRLDLGPRSARLLGARYSIRLTGPIAGEVTLAFGGSERTVYAPAVVDGEFMLDPLGDADVLMMLGEGGFRFHLTGPRTWHGLAPYGVGTVGLVTDLRRSDPREAAQLPEERFEFGPGFAAGIGLGSDLFLTERFSLRADVRDHLWRLTYPVGLSGTGERENEWRHNFGFTFGGSIHF